MANPFFELNNILTLEAAELVYARGRAYAMHKFSDIDAAGDEVEKAKLIKWFANQVFQKLTIL
jgi:hypothetical protein